MAQEPESKVSHENETTTTERRAKAIQLIPGNEAEYLEIKTAAESTKRSLASFCLFYALEAARKINQAD